jgi:hypothetical protein
VLAFTSCVFDVLLNREHRTFSAMDGMSDPSPQAESQATPASQTGQNGNGEPATNKAPPNQTPGHPSFRRCVCSSFVRSSATQLTLVADSAHLELVVSSPPFIQCSHHWEQSPQSSYGICGRRIVEERTSYRIEVNLEDALRTCSLLFVLLSLLELVVDRDPRPKLLYIVITTHKPPKRPIPRGALA